MAMTIDIGALDKGKDSKLEDTKSEKVGPFKGRAQSLPGDRTARSAWTNRRNRSPAQTVRNTFGIIPTYHSNAISNRAAWVKKLEEMKSVDKDAEQFFKGKGDKLIESPTTMKMQNTFLLMNTNPSFDQYAEMMKRRKKPKGGSFATGSLKDGNNSPRGEDGEILPPSTLKINKKVPAPRDGHVAFQFNGKMLIFGGDRHHMPFNDLFMIDVNDFFFKNK